MSEVQRWNINHVLGRVYIDEKSEGGWVTYADHVAAVAAAEQRGYNRGYDFGRRDTLDAAVGVSESHDAGVKAAREAVEAENKNPISRVTTDYDIGYRDGTNDTVRLHLRAIDALRGGS